MKKFAYSLIAFIVIATVFLGGCSLSIQPVEMILRPPKLTSDYADLQKAFDSVVKEQVTLKTPLGGEYRSAYIMFDINNDSVDEALVFYTLKNDKSARVNLLQTINGVWTSIADISGEGPDIAEVSFIDMNNNGIYEVLVSWQFTDSRNQKMLTIFECKNGAGGALGFDIIATRQQYSAMLCVDVDSDKRSEIFLVTQDIASKDVKATGNLIFMSKNDNDKISSAGKISLASNVISYKQLKTDYYKGVCRIYIDSILSEASMMTEIVYWDNSTATGKLVTPFLSDAKVHKTIRTISPDSYTADINGDGMMEIPRFVLIEESKKYGGLTEDEGVYISEWSAYFQDTDYHAVKQYIDNKTSGYKFLIKDEWKNSITVTIDTASNKMSVYKLNTKSDQNEKRKGDLLFELNMFTKPLWNEEAGSGYEIVASNDENIYTMLLTPAGQASPFTYELVKELIELY